MTKMIQIDDAHLRADDISHLKIERGANYTALKITMRDGSEYWHRDYLGSACKAERAILDAIEAQP